MVCRFKLASSEPDCRWIKVLTNQCRDCTQLHDTSCRCQLVFPTSGWKLAAPKAFIIQGVKAVQLAGFYTTAIAHHHIFRRHHFIGNKPKLLLLFFKHNEHFCVCFYCCLWGKSLSCSKTFALLWEFFFFWCSITV